MYSIKYKGGKEMLNKPREEWSKEEINMYCRNKAINKVKNRLKQQLRERVIVRC